MNLVSVNSDDWKVIYLDGEKLIEDHSISWEWLLEVLQDKGLITYNMKAYDLTDSCVEDVLNYQFPNKVSDFPKKLRIR
ncbi:MAG TPA: hypothetical protein VIK72_09485 [Clostridiaceae bacterium]